jgi:putative drug exporter of the RND superfamily
MLRKLATAIVERPRLVLGATAIFLVLAGVFGGGVSDRLGVGGFDDPGSESAAAGRFLDERFGASPNLVLQVTAKNGDVDAPEVAAKAAALTRWLQQEPDVKVVGSYWSGAPAELRSTDRRSALVLLHLSGTEEAAAKHTRQIVDRLPVGDPAVKVRAGGQLGLTGEIESRVHADLVLSESIALPATLILLVVAFGGVVAALVPLAMGVASIMTTLLTLLGLSLLTDVSVHALTVATAFGLGLAIDFGLLMVSRFREERERGHAPKQAVVETVATAGRTILFSAATVTFAMAGLLAFPLYFLRSVGLAAIAVVVVAAAGAVVVLPALLAVAGGRIDSLMLIRRRAAVSTDSAFWRRTAAAAMRRPAVASLPVVALLLVMAAPFLHAQFAPADERALPVASAARQVTASLRTDYPADITSAITVVAEKDNATLEVVGAEISQLPDVAFVDGAYGRFGKGKQLVEAGPAAARFNADGAGYLLVQPSVDGRSDAAQQLVRSIRALPDVAQHRLAVGGPAAVQVDSKAAIVDRLGIVLAVVAIAMFVLLFLFTGSVVIPLKALILNALVLSAVLGAMVWLFQDGNLGSLLGVTPAPLNIPMTVLLCCIVFGLSVDYEIFLLSRIKEAREAGASTVQATVDGLGKVGRIVTSAAALLTVTLFSFATGLSFMKMFGIGTGLAILLDATMVRGVLVPAFMRVAGEVNWWAPRPLRRLHAVIGLRESQAPPARVVDEPTVRVPVALATAERAELEWLRAENAALHRLIAERLPFTAHATPSNR